MRSKPGRSCLCAALASLAVLACADTTHAQVKQVKAAKQERQVGQVRQVGRVLRFLGGGAAGLVVHEAGHIATGLAMGADPGFKRLDYGFIPFFAITHDTVSRRREYLISSSGFHAQHLANELLLRRGSRAGGLRASDGAFRKGWLTFNVATSAVYTAAAIGRFGAPERDTLGMARFAGDAGVPEPVIGVMILVPAALDGVRYLCDDPAWARWTSRAVKTGLLLIAVR